jgi:hypothetical protein
MRRERADETAARPRAGRVAVGDDDGEAAAETCPGAGEAEDAGAHHQHIRIRGLSHVAKPD